MSESSEPNAPARQIFISYCHVDAEWLSRLRTHLTPLLDERRLSLWDDERIAPGKWRPQIQEALDRAAVAVLLVSPDYLASEFVTQTELPALFTAANRGQTVVLWIAVRPSAVDQTRIGDYQALNDPTRPLSALEASDQDRTLVQISKRIREIADGLSAHPPPRPPPEGPPAHPRRSWRYAVVATGLALALGGTAVWHTLRGRDHAAAAFGVGAALAMIGLSDQHAGQIVLERSLAGLGWRQVEIELFSERYGSVDRAVAERRLDHQQVRGRQADLLTDIANRLAVLDGAPEDAYVTVGYHTAHLWLLLRHWDTLEKQGDVLGECRETIAALQQSIARIPEPTAPTARLERIRTDEVTSAAGRERTRRALTAVLRQYGAVLGD